MVFALNQSNPNGIGLMNSYFIDRFFGLDTAEYEVISVQETESKMEAIRAGTGFSCLQ